MEDPRPQTPIEAIINKIAIQEGMSSEINDTHSTFHLSGHNLIIQLTYGDHLAEGNLPAAMDSLVRLLTELPEGSRPIMFIDTTDMGMHASFDGVKVLEPLFAQLARTQAIFVFCSPHRLHRMMTNIALQLYQRFSGTGAAFMVASSIPAVLEEIEQKFGRKVNSDTVGFVTEIHTKTTDLK